MLVLVDPEQARIWNEVTIPMLDEKLNARIEKHRQLGHTIELLDVYSTHTAGGVHDIAYRRALLLVDGVETRWYYDWNLRNWRKS